MFEKEAGERLPKAKINYCNSFQCKPDEVPAIEMVRFGSGYTKGFKDGAEYGYNKANEWHYVKDELPRIINDYFSNDLIFLTKDCSGNITKHFGYFSFRKDFEEYNTEDRFTPDEVIAWKEIVLPELKESK